MLKEWSYMFGPASTPNPRTRLQSAMSAIALLIIDCINDLEFPGGENWKTLGLTGEETFEILGLDDSLQPRSTVTVNATAADHSVKTFQACVRIDTPVELDYYKNGGILQTVVRKLLAS